ncbi:hepcidin [Austrofundulus limnaeus]|uniref:Hepcidin n=1 Tax=Austrofundulus limnaeus TaxID=52670 RepID=A0A2I4D491_AUSLI|nr:PREDICTED: hepcidin-like [Austrofundulus limnaeus]
MKSFSVAVAVAIVLTFICLQECSAVPITEDQQLIDSVNPPDAPVGEYPVFPADSWKMPYYFRQRNDPRRCRFCCNCCPGMSGCGVCCRF